MRNTHKHLKGLLASIAALLVLRGFATIRQQLKHQKYLKCF